MSRKKPAPDLIRGGHRFSEKDMRQRKKLDRPLRRSDRLHVIVQPVSCLSLSQQREIVGGEGSKRCVVTEALYACQLLLLVCAQVESGSVLLSTIKFACLQQLVMKIKIAPITS
jgi:hypothetical protein